MTIKYLKTSIVLLVVWAVAILIGALDFGLFDYFSWKLFGKTILNYVKAILAPIVSVVVMSIILFLMNKKDKKPLTTVLSTITVTQIPAILAEIVGLITVISSNAIKITSRVTSLTSIISTVLMYFAIKNLYGEDDEKTAFNTFVIIQAIYVVTELLVSYLGIYI